MKIAALIARMFLGLVFFVFGLNHFLLFIPMGPIPAGVAGQFVSAMISSHYMYVVAAIEILGAIPLLINRYVPLGLTLLAPVIVNIVITSVLLEPMGLPIAAVITLLWLLTYYRVRSAFAGLFQQRVEA